MGDHEKPKDEPLKAAPRSTFWGGPSTSDLWNAVQSLRGYSGQWFQYLERRLTTLTSQGENLVAHLDSLTAEVKRNTTVAQSAVTLLHGLGAKIEELKNDPAALQALANELNSTTTTLSDAVSANTPADPAAPVGGAKRP